MKRQKLWGALGTTLLFCIAGPPAVGQRKPSKAKVTPDQANVAVLKKYHGKIVGKTKLENEDGKWQYAVSVQSGKTFREVMVDANTGKIANVEVTTPAKERAEEKADAAKAKKKKPH